jgi:MFS family permease
VGGDCLPPAFGSLLLFGGRLGDLIRRKITFLAGALGFAAASAAGGAATGFVMLVAARAAQGAFGAQLAPAALSILSTRFSDPKVRRCGPSRARPRGEDQR